MAIRTLDMSAYPRRDHFQAFLSMSNPGLQVTVPVDITSWLAGLKRSGFPFFLSFQYAVVRAANRVPEFRQRVSGGGIVEYSFCDPSYTVARPDGTYRYCLVHADQPFADYLAEAEKKQRAALSSDRLEEEGDVLGQFFVTTLPWLSYDSLIMPWPDSSFSIPNFGWGKAVRDVRLVLENGVPAEKETVTLPVTVMVNHALIDGLHLSRFFDCLREELDRFWNR